jgi:hypothetical protein
MAYWAIELRTLFAPLQLREVFRIAMDTQWMTAYPAGYKSSMHSTIIIRALNKNWQQIKMAYRVHHIDLYANLIQILPDNGRRHGYGFTSTDQ